jgi:transposase
MAWSNKEVDVSRPASVFVRELTGEEAVKLRRVSRQSKVFALRQRAQIVLASDARSTASEIARVLQTDENQVRRVIREFNEMGMDCLRPPSGGGCPRRIDYETRERIRAVALARPQDLGEPFTRWSLTTLRRYLVREEIVDRVSREHLRRILKSFHITAQRTRTWKKSNDPHFEQKKSWVLSAYRGAEAGTINPLGDSKTAIRLGLELSRRVVTALRMPKTPVG